MQTNQIPKYVSLFQIHLTKCFWSFQILRNTKEPEDMAKARHAILVSLPLPVEIPDDSLKPILIPSPFTLHEFLSNASGVSSGYLDFTAPSTYLSCQSLRNSSVIFQSIKSKN